MKLFNITNTKFSTILLISLLSIYHQPIRTNASQEPTSATSQQATQNNNSALKNDFTTLVFIVEQAVAQKDLFPESEIAAAQAALDSAKPYLATENIDDATLEKALVEFINACKPILEKLAQQANTQSADEVAPTSPVNVVDDTISQGQKMLSGLASVLTDLASMINNGQINSLKNKSEALRNIQHCIEMLHSITNDKFPEASPLIAFNILEINEHLNKHIHTAIKGKNGFTQFPAFDIQNIVVKKGKRDGITAQQLQDKIKVNIKINEALTKNFDHVGLTTWNKQYRKFDKYVVTPCVKNAKNLMGIGAVVTLGLYGYWALWGFDENGFLGKKFGSPTPVFDPRATGDTKVITPAYKTVSQLELVLSRLFSQQSLFVGGCLYAASSDFIKKQWVKHWEKNLYTKIQIWHNQQKGGAFLHKANKLDKHYTGKVTFDDVIGLETMKATFSDLIEYILNPETFDRLGITPPKGYLLAGGARTGKTFIVSALANELKKRMQAQGLQDADVKFFPFHSAEVTELGGIKYIMSLAKYAAPCILFIDEIDLLYLQRSGANATLSEFLVSLSGAMDEIDPKNQVIVIAATNQPESLDFALTNYGRLGRPIFFDLPTLSQRKEQLTRKIKKMCLNPANFNLDQLAQETEKWSYAKLDVMVKGALIASRVRGDVLTQAYLDSSLNQLRGVTPKIARIVSKKETELLATHFAGNALALQLLDVNIKMSAVTLDDVAKDVGEKMMGSHLFEPKNTPQHKKDEFDHGAVFTYNQYDSLNILSYKEKITLCKYYLAGIAAEQLILGHASYACHPQAKQHAYEIALSLAYEGIDPQQVPTEMQTMYYKKAQTILETCQHEVKLLLEQHMPALKAISAALVEKRTLKQIDIEQILKAIDSNTHSTAPAHTVATA